MPCNPDPQTGTDLASVKTPYQITLTKDLPSGGQAIIRGPKASTVAEAEAGFERARNEYIATGMWGGSG